MRYRRRKVSLTWHFRPDCMHWPVYPTNAIVEQDELPTFGSLCKACLRLEERAA